MLHTQTRVVTILLGIVAFLPIKLANARPSPQFGSTEAGFFASEIVVVRRATPRGNKFTIQSSWRGQLQGGESIVVEGVPTPEPGECEARQDCDSTIAGTHLILFLIKVDEHWQGATSWGPLAVRTMTSVVWIEGHRLFAFGQHQSPGPLRLHPLYKSSLLKLRQLVGTQDKPSARYRRVMSMPSGLKKARRLEALTRSPRVVHRAQRAAVVALASCGPPALRYLGRILADSGREELHRDAVRSIVKVDTTESQLGAH